MGRKMKKRLLFIIGSLLLSLWVSACSPKIDTNMSEHVHEFSFMTQDEKTFSLGDLKGDWWIAYFSYTVCRKVCPRTTANMVNVQDELKEDNLHPHIISFTIDPSNDTPEDLKDYADEYGVDLTTWDFLTGYDFATIQDLSKNTFQANLEQGAADQV